MRYTEIKSCYLGPEISPEQFVPEHFFLFLAKGSITGYDGSKKYELKSGESCIVKKNHLARYHKQKDNGDFEKVVVIFDKAFLKTFQDKHQSIISTSEEENAFILLKKDSMITNFISSLSAYYNNEGKIDEKFKTDVAMMGKLGYDVKVNELDEKELLFSQNAVKTYNGIKDIVWHGQQYRLQDPYENKVAAISFVSEARDTAIIFNYYVSTLYNAKNSIPIKLKGLDPGKMYRIEEINLYPGTTSPIDSQRSYSGDFLMTVGINPEADASRTSVVLKAIAL